jgi:predicted nucleic acid-binding Zn ribbon protein
MNIVDFDVRKYAWFRRGFWMATENDEMGTFDDVLGAEFELRTRFKLGKPPCSGDVETQIGHGDLLLDAMSIAEMKSLMRVWKRKRLKVCPICGTLIGNINKTCSNACRKISVKRKSKPAFLHGTCARCTKAMTAPRGKLLNKYCSKECRSVIAKERYEAELLTRQTAYQQSLVSFSADTP